MLKNLKNKLSLVMTLVLIMALIFPSTSFACTVVKAKQAVNCGTATAVLCTDGRVRTCGGNAYGELGNGTSGFYTSTTTFSDIGISGIKQLTAGNGRFFALRNDGRVMAWGLNGGALGLGDSTDRCAPTLIPNLSNVTRLVTGAGNTYAFISNDTVKMWGSDRLGDGNVQGSNIPILLPLTGVKDIVIGFSQVYALMNDGTAKKWGSSSYGELAATGTNSFYPGYTEILTPTDVGYSGIVSIGATCTNTYLVFADGSVKSCGWGWYYANCDGTQYDRYDFVNTNLTNVKAIHGGFYHAVIEYNDGTFKTVGYGIQGEMGNGTFLSSDVPVTPDIGSNGKSIVKMEANSMGDCTFYYSADGDLYGSGDNQWGSLTGWQNCDFPSPYYMQLN